MLKLKIISALLTCIVYCTQSMDLNQIAAAPAVIGAPVPICNARHHPNADWMKNYQDKSMLELILPGSHDAGCIKRYNHDIMTNSAVTQTKGIGEQLCAGARVFDIRFEWAIQKDDRDAGYYIHHGSNTILGDNTHFYFQSMPDFTSEIQEFCNAYDTELLVLRIKYETRGDSQNSELEMEKREKFLQHFIEEINSGARNCVVKHDDAVKVSCILFYFPIVLVSIN